MDIATFQLQVTGLDPGYFSATMNTASGLGHRLIEMARSARRVFGDESAGTPEQGDVRPCPGIPLPAGRQREGQLTAGSTAADDSQAFRMTLSRQ